VLISSIGRSENAPPLRLISLAMRNHGPTRTTHLWVLFLFALLVQPATSQSFNFNIGGGLGVPVSQTGNFAKTSYNFVAGAGPNLFPHVKLVGEFMLQGLPVQGGVIREFKLSPKDVKLFSPTGRLYSFTGNFIVGAGRDERSVYLIGGGGWYRRTVAAHDRIYQAGAACPPAVVWWNVQCVNGVFPTTVTIGSTSLSAGGFNIGVGAAFALGSSGANLYTEVRYHHALTRGVATDVLPLTFGVRW